MNFRVLAAFATVILAAAAFEDFSIKITNTPQIGFKKSVTTKSDIQTRIFGGKTAKAKQIPYQAGLSIHIVKNKIRNWCGGSLIARGWILTAAHCVYRKKIKTLENGSSTEIPGVFEIVPRVDVYLGMTNKDNILEEGRQFFMVTTENIIKHEQYIPSMLHNDIALLKLPKEAVLNEYVKLINLPNRSYNQNDLTGRTIISSGWGIFDTINTSSMLRYAKFNIISYDKCKNIFLGILKNSMHVCMSAPDKSACRGDSGGPNVCIEKDGTETLIGISSFIVRGRCNSGDPTVLTRVHAYLDWINKKTGIEIEN